MGEFKLGRHARAHNPRVPHLSALLAGQTLPAPPAAVDYTAGMPSDLGAMLNNSLGDCTCAAAGHALQVWSFNANPPMLTAPDSAVESLYEGACGYNPADPSSDQGGIEQEVLKYLVQTGLSGNKLTAFIEVDPRNTDDVKRTIVDCGVCYIGFNVPAYLMSSLTGAGSIWDVDPGADNSIVGGHAVVLAGYDANGAKVISWGQIYTMTWAFFAQFVDEAYALADQGWIETTGSSPAGLTLGQLQAQMQALAEPR